MKPEIKELWVDALTSNKYQQTKCSLRRENSFCCLGVLCDLYLDHSGDTNSEWSSWDVGTISFNHHPLGKEASYDDEFLPDCVRQWAGIEEDNPCIEVNNVEGPIALSKLNDDGYTFEQIAKFIKEQL